MATFQTIAALFMIGTLFLITVSNLVYPKNSIGKYLGMIFLVGALVWIIRDAWNRSYKLRKYLPIENNAIKNTFAFIITLLYMFFILSIITYLFRLIR